MNNTNSFPAGYNLLHTTAENNLVVGIDHTQKGVRRVTKIEFGDRPYTIGDSLAVPSNVADKYYAIREYTPLPTKAENDAKAVLFATELKALLVKHNVTIMWTCADGSDTHGIYDENMIIQENNTSNNLIEIWGASISSSDL